MTRFAYVTDLHLRSRVPNRRTDKWPDTPMRKLRQVMDIAEREGAEFVLCGGDLFDSPRPAWQLFIDAVKEIRRLPWYMVIGNHDEFGHSLESYRDGVIGILEELLPEFWVQSLKNPGYFTRGNLEFALYHYEHGIDGQKVFMSNRTPKSTMYQIVCAHAHVLLHEAVFDHVRIDEVKTDADLFLCAHYHEQFSPRMVDGTCFVAPGSMVRLEASKHNLTHQPKMLIIDAEEVLKIREFVLDHEPAAQAFDLKRAERDKQWNSRIDEFVRSMESYKVQGLDLMTRVKRLAKQEDVDPAVVALVLQKLEEHERN